MQYLDIMLNAWVTHSLFRFDLKVINDFVEPFISIQDKELVDKETIEKEAEVTSQPVKSIYCYLINESKCQNGSKFVSIILSYRLLHLIPDFVKDDVVDYFKKDICKLLLFTYTNIKKFLYSYR